MLHIIGKVIDLESSTILFNEPFSKENLSSNWKIYGGDWWVEDEWLTGKNHDNNDGRILSKADYPGNIIMEFEAQTVLPSTHDIDFSWNSSWDEERNRIGTAYIAGIEGWWDGKAGIEKSPGFKLIATTKLFDFQPGKIYKIQGGSIDGHCFLFIDGSLVLEVTDPDPIDANKHAKVGFEAYCSYFRIRNLKIRRIKWEPVDLSYKQEF